MRKISTLFAASASLVAMFAAVPNIALAQTPQGAAADEDSDEGTIIVTARRKDEDLQEVPLSVQVVGGNALQKLEIRNFVDVASVVPGLSLTRATNGIQNTVTLRGVSFNPTAAGPQTAVELYRNDVVTSSAAIFQAVYDLQQIEVLRGPQGTLKGRASPSGSLTITTRKPDLEEVGVFASGSLAQGSEWNASGAVNVPVIPGKLAIRVASFGSRDRASDIDRINLFTRTIDDDGYDRVKSFRGSVRAQPVDAVTLDFNYEKTKRNSRTFEQVQSRNGVDGTTLTGPVAISSKDRLGIQVLPFTLNGTYEFYNWQAQFKIGGQQLTYVGGRLNAVSNSLAPEDNGGFLANPFAAPAGAPTVSVPGTINPFAQRTTSIQKQRFAEVRLQNSERIAGLFDYVVGFMNLKSNTPTLLYTTGSACTGCVPATNTVGTLSAQTYAGVYRTRSDEEKSIFGNLTLHLGDKFEIGGGVRRINFARDSGLISGGRDALGRVLIDAEPLDSLLALRTPAAAFALVDEIKHTIYTGAAKFQVSDDFLVYANYGTSFRPGNVVVCARCTAAQNTALTPLLRMPNETSNSIEAGVKTSFLDKRATFNLAVFRQKFKNFTVISPAIQFLASNPPPAAGFFGSPQALAAPNDVKVTGFEAEASYRASDRFNLGLTLAYAKSKAANGRIPCVDLDNDNIQDATSLTTAAQAATFATQAGTGLVDTCAFSSASPAPRLSGTFQGEYNQPFSDSMSGYLRALWTYNGKTPGDDNNPFDQVKSYSLINMYLGVRNPDGKWDFSLYGKNLTNTHRVLTRNGTRASSTIGGVAYTSDYYQISTTAPREFGVNLKLAFGSK